MPSEEARIDAADADDTGDAGLGAVEATRWLNVGAVIRGEGHTWVGDEPEWSGGDGTGPSPFGQVAGALAHCTISTLAARAALEEIPLEGVHVSVRPLVTVSGEKVTRPEELHLDDEENITARIAKLVRAIEVSGELSESQVDRLLEIAEICPVSESLQPSIRIRTTLNHVGSGR